MTEIYTPIDGGLEPQPLPAELSALALAFQARQATPDAIRCAAGQDAGTHETALGLIADRIAEGEPIVAQCPTCRYLAWLTTLP